MQGRSAYVLYSIAIRETVKAELEPGFKVTEIMKEVSRRWRELSEAGKAYEYGSNKLLPWNPI